MSRSGFVLPLLGALVVAIAAGCLASPARADWSPDALPLAVPPVATPSPAPAWTPTPEPRAQPASRGGRDAVEELARRYFPAELVPWVMSTAACESGYDPWSRRHGYDSALGVYYDFRGPLHVDAVTWAGKARELGYDLDTPEGAMAMAAWIRRNLGRQPWPYCGFRGGW